MVMIRMIVTRLAMHRRGMRRDMAPVAHIVNGVCAPISMVVLPALEAMQSVRIHDYPAIAGSQIIILATYNADVFRAVIIVIVRDNGYWRRYNHYWWWHRGRYHNRRRGRRRDNDGRSCDTGKGHYQPHRYSRQGVFAQ